MEKFEKGFSHKGLGVDQKNRIDGTQRQAAQ